MRITIYTRKGEQRRYVNVNSYDVHNVGPGLLTFRHDDRYIEYYRLGSIDRWTIETEGEEWYSSDEWFCAEGKRKENKDV